MWHHQLMNQERLQARFSYAQALWLASFFVVLRRDQRSVQSQALLKTTAGVAAKRDILALCSRQNRRGSRLKIDPTWFVMVIALAGTGVMLAVLHALGA